MTNIFESDPRFTAYLLGELSANDARAVERLLAEHPEDAAEWEKTRHLIARLEETLENEAVPENVAGKSTFHQTFKEITKMDKKTMNENASAPKKGRWIWRLTGVVALLVVAGGLVALILPPVQQARTPAYSVALSHMEADSTAPGGPTDGDPQAAYSDEEAKKSLPSAEESRYADRAKSAGKSDEEERRQPSLRQKPDQGKDKELDLRVDDGVLVQYPDTEVWKKLTDARVSQYNGRAENPPATPVVSPGSSDAEVPYEMNWDARKVKNEVNIRYSQAAKEPLATPAEKSVEAAIPEVEPEVTHTDASSTGDQDNSSVYPVADIVMTNKSLAPMGGGVIGADGKGMGLEGALANQVVTHNAAGDSMEQGKSSEIQAMRLFHTDPYNSANDETYKAFVENVFEDPAAKPFSTFGVDVDSASYTVMRQYLTERDALPPAGAVRVEEYINYFKYALAPPADDDKTPFAVKTDLFAHPWQDGLMMLKITLKGKEIAKENRPPLNLVFLIDVSGSMSGWNRLPLVKSSMLELLDQLTERDRVAIVTYANGTQVNLTPTTVTKDGSHEITKVINSLGAGGGTSGGAGLRLAYAEAKKNYNGEAVNRIILCTDGDFNIGETGDASMEEIVTAGAKDGVFLTVLGFGMGNYKDARLKLLSDKGNGNYGYIDTKEEAKRMLVENLSGTMITIAKDVKIQLDFNPKHVGAYRLIGYENRKMAAKDFHDDKKDSGEIGAGHTVTALYEIVPKGFRVPNKEPVSRYAEGAAEEGAEPEVAESKTAERGEMLTVSLRYKLPTEDTSTLMDFKQQSPESMDALPRMDAESHFASAVALYAMILRKSEYIGTGTLDTVLELAQPGVGDDAARKEFIELAKKAKGR